MDKVLTTGQIARALRVTPRTVGKWIDSGQLPGFRLPKTNKQAGRRRILARDLAAFVRSTGMPVDWLCGLCDTQCRGDRGECPQ